MEINKGCKVVITKIQKSQGIRLWYEIKNKEGNLVCLDNYLYLTPDCKLDRQSVIQQVLEEASSILEEKFRIEKEYEGLIGTDLMIDNLCLN